MSSPRSQYDRNITFRIMYKNNLIDSFTFSIRPEQWQMDTPARMSTVSTLQGTYQDFGGLAPSKITINGHTGWSANNPNGDGFSTFQQLYENTYKQYHQIMSQADDPSQVQCLLINELYDAAYDVSLDSFSATKSRSNPLLYYYQMTCTVKSESNVDGYVPVDWLNSTLSAQTNSQIAGSMSIISMYAPTQIGAYQTAAGDTFQTISQKFYQRTDRDKDIAKANAYINVNTTFSGGQILVIPF